MTDTPRASALGGAGAALADEAGSSLENPAALGLLRSREVQAGYAALPASLSYGSLSYVQPFSRAAAALHVHALDYGDVRGLDAFDNPSKTFSARDTLLAAGWGRPIGRMWSFGIGIKQVSQSIADRSGSTVAEDAGILWRPSPGVLTLSAGVRNLGGQASFVREKTSLPRTIHAGGAARLFSEGWILSAEYRRPADGTASFHVGQELWLHNVLAIRAGYRSDREMGAGLVFGFGVKLKSARLDYSFAPLGDAFGQAHRAGLSFRFGGAGEKAFQEGLRLAQQGHHAEAILKFKDVLDADPDHKGAVRALRESVQALEKERGNK